jgi:hypothetical protein
VNHQAWQRGAAILIAGISYRANEFAATHGDVEAGN